MGERKMNYFRPKSREELETLMQQYDGHYLFLTGGDYNVKGYQEGDVLLDLQDMGMDQLVEEDGVIVMGGLSPLDALFKESPLWDDFREALRIEGGWNIRNGLSLDNFLRVANGRSPLLTCLRALEGSVLVQPDMGYMALDDYLQDDYNERDFFIENLTVTKPKAVAYEQVARSPKDLPIVSVAVVQDLDGSVVVTVGGHEALLGGLVFEPGTTIQTDAICKLFEDTDDEWASSDYRQDVARSLLTRCLAKLGLI